MATHDILCLEIVVTPLRLSKKVGMLFPKLLKCFFLIQKLLDIWQFEMAWMTLVRLGIGFMASLNQDERKLYTNFYVSAKIILN